MNCRRIQKLNQDVIKEIGWIGTIMSLLMYFSYIVLIYNNLHGQKANFIQPLAAFFNCLVWTIYGFGIKPKQWPLIIANVPGIFLAGAAVLTCF